jgi:type IV secretory pathway VirB10-like protein
VLLAVNFFVLLLIFVSNRKWNRKGKEGKNNIVSEKGKTTTNNKTLPPPPPPPPPLPPPPPPLPFVPPFH